MRLAEEYRRHAAECEALARRAKTAEEREMIAMMVNTWRLLAERQERLLEKRAQDAATGALPAKP